MLFFLRLSWVRQSGRGKGEGELQWNRLRCWGVESSRTTFGGSKWSMGAGEGCGVLVRCIGPRAHGLQDALLSRRVEMVTTFQRGLQLYSSFAVPLSLIRQHILCSLQPPSEARYLDLCVPVTVFSHLSWTHP